MLEKLYIIILNWNLKDDTIACVESLIQAGAAAGQIIVVDNGSSDGSPEAIQGYFKPPPLALNLGQNLGYAGGMNRGIQLALDCGAEWLLLLNNDVVVAEKMLVELEKAVAAVPQNTILAPLILDYFQKDRISYVGDRRIFGTLITRTLYRGAKATRTLPDILPVDFFTGCAMLIPAGVFKSVGLFDTRYFMYAEDVDFCWRAQEAGIGLACATEARLWHKVSASSSNQQPTIRYWRIKNQIRFYRRYSQRLQIPVMFLFTLLRSLLIIMKDFFQHHPGLLHSSWQGFWDGWQGNLDDIAH